MKLRKASVVVFTEFQSINLILCVFWFQDAGNKDIQTVQALTLTSFYTNRCDNCKAICQLEANNAATKENWDVAYCGCNKTAWKCLILAHPQDDRVKKWRLSNICFLFQPWYTCIELAIWVDSKMLVPQFGAITSFPMGPASQGCGATIPPLTQNPKMKHILSGRRSSADLFSRSLPSVLSLLSLPLTSFRLRRCCLCCHWSLSLVSWNAHCLVCWLGGWPAGWIVRFCRVSWCLEAAREVAGVYLYMWAMLQI